MNIDNYNTPDDAIAAASKLDSHGEWATAIELYRQAAERWPEHEEYIQGCIDSITEKRSLEDGSCRRGGLGRVDRGMFSCCGGCGLTFVLCMAGLLVWTPWAIFEPARRAERVHNTIKRGDSFEDVESLLTGRHFCFYQVERDEGWETVSRPEFIEVLETAPADAPPAVRLSLHFLGWSPYRVSFYVELDHAGKVTKATEPYGWD